MKKTKIILDADVIIHFSKGGWLNKLPEIMKGYDCFVLDVVYKEILKPTRIKLDNQMQLLKNISVLPFVPKGEMRKEYARLISKSGSNLGKGESACMIYCRCHNDIIGSSNLKDIKDYSSKYGLTYLTTIDFLYYAIKNKIMKIEEADKFIIEVTDKDSKLPKNIDFKTFVSSVVL